MPNFFDHILTMPTKSATTVVLLRNELSAATGTISLTTALEYVSGCPNRFFTIHCNTPVCVSPATTTNSTPMTTTEPELKPEKASLASSTPVTNRMPMAPRNTRSARSFVSSKMVNIVSTVTMVIHAWRLNPQKTIESILLNSQSDKKVCYLGTKLRFFYVCSNNVTHKMTPRVLFPFSPAVRHRALAHRLLV